MVVDEGVYEESEEVLNDIRELVGREVVHDAKECERLLLEEAVDMLGGRWVDEFGSGGKFAKD